MRAAGVRMDDWPGAGAVPHAWGADGQDHYNRSAAEAQVPLPLSLSRSLSLSIAHSLTHSLGHHPLIRLLAHAITLALALTLSLMDFSW